MAPHRPRPHTTNHHRSRGGTDDAHHTHHPHRQDGGARRLPPAQRRDRLDAAHPPGARGRLQPRRLPLLGRDAQRAHRLDRGARLGAPPPRRDLDVGRRHPRRGREPRRLRPAAGGAVVSLLPVALVSEVTNEWDGSPGLTVRLTWPLAGVDRPETMGWRLPNTPNGRRLAQRLMAAIEAGVAVTEPAIVADVNGKTYVEAHSHVLGRTMNADLKRLGY